MKQTVVEWFYQRILSKDIKAVFEQAKEMEKQKNISLVEWIRENTIEVQDGWQYLGELYTDKQIIEIYNTKNK